MISDSLTCERITERLSHKNYYGINNCLHNRPTPLPNQAEPMAIYFNAFLSLVPEYSVVVPVHNMERIIVRNIRSIIEFTVGLFELIIILDSCTDETKPRLLNFATSLQHTKKLTTLTIIEQSTPIFETACDNIGFTLSLGKYIVEIQADMQMTERGFNETLSLPLRQYGDVIAVSGRCSHSFLNQSAQHTGVGRMGALIDDASFVLPPLQFYINGTCNRGPLLLSQSKLAQLEYLDEKNFALGNDDHDLFARAFYKHNFVCGYVPIDFLSPQKDGTTRQPRSKLENDTLLARLARSDGGFLKEIEWVSAPPTSTRPLNTTQPKQLAVRFSYGNVDVTDLACATFVQQNEIRIQSSVSFNSVFTDVLPGVVKTLLVYFLDDETTIALPELRSKDYMFRINMLINSHHGWQIK